MWVMKAINQAQQVLCENCHKMSDHSHGPSSWTNLFLLLLMTLFRVYLGKLAISSNVHD